MKKIKQIMKKFRIFKNQNCSQIIWKNNKMVKMDILIIMIIKLVMIYYININKK